MVSILIVLTLIAAVFCTVESNATFDDLPGVYDVMLNGLPFCGKVVQVQSAGNALTSLKFDGVERCTLTLVTLKQMRVAANVSNAQDYGTYITSGTGQIGLLCQGSVLSSITLVKPINRVSVTVTGFADPVVLNAGVKYLGFEKYLGGGGCLYRQRGGTNNTRTNNNRGTTSTGNTNTDINRGTSTDNTNTGNTNTGTNGGGGSVSNNPTDTSGQQTSDGDTLDVNDQQSNSGGGDAGIWVWLGPVIGAAATIVAALMGVYCYRKRRSNGSDDVASGVTGGVHVNVSPPPNNVQQGGYNMQQQHTSPTAYGQPYQGVR